jgi:pilus assembly protein CpaE
MISIRLYRDLVSSGIQDYLLKPFSAEQFREAVAHAQAILAAPRVDASAERPHVMAGVIGVRGGVGASTIATSIAWLCSEKEKRSTALLDLDVHFGTGALALDLEPGRGLTDAIENPGRIDGLFIERAMVRANEKLSILSAEAPINQPLLTDGGAFYQLQEEMRSVFECTVVDLPRQMLVQHPHLVNDMQSTVVVTELTLAGARDMIRILSWLKSNAPQSQIVTVANRVGLGGGSEISQKDFEASIERKIDVCIPFDSKTASHAAKLGKPLAEIAKSTKVGHGLVYICARILATTEEAESAPEKMSPGKKKKEVRDSATPKGETKSFMSKFSGFKLKMPGKKKTEATTAPELAPVE